MKMREAVLDTPLHGLPCGRDRRVSEVGAIACFAFNPRRGRGLQHTAEKSLQRAVAQQHGAVLPERDEGHAPAVRALGLRLAIGKRLGEPQAISAAMWPERAKPASRA